MNPKNFTTHHIFNDPQFPHLIQTAEECRSSENNASNDTFKVKIGRLFTPHSMFEFPEECAFSQL